MRILLINDFFYGGGAEEVFRITKAVLKEERFTVRLFYGTEYATTKPRNVLSYFFSRTSKDKLSRVLNEFRPEIIHIHNFYHFLTGSIFYSIKKYRENNKVKVIFTAHDYYLVSPSSHLLYYDRLMIPRPIPLVNAFKYQLFKKIDKRGWHYSIVKKMAWIFQHYFIQPQNQIDIIIAPSFFLKKVFVKNNVFSNIKCIRNPLRSNIEFSFKKLKSSKIEDLKFVYFGRLSPEKGILEFLRLLLKYNVAIQLDIIGDGPSKKEIEEFLVINKILKVNLLGQIPNEKLLLKLKEYHVSVIPSIGYENAPLTIAESANAGLIILGSNLGGIPELCHISGVPHYLYSPDKDSSFFNTIKKLKEDIKLGLDICPNIKDFSVEEYYRKLRDIYKEIFAQ